ncbi:hypothetical protein CPT_Pascal44 [Bacillus phage Pascal]|uniref:Uncharacterized protein n=1 Tax=Bacillus phage Pascal TaxID=1540092 RepID=A0A0A0RPW4_9CAUD|nr:hypothetical protein CPT_Pascal44 [Bacillus phage Pascal]AIW03679.1 hypothetical protein CPT_Pascal44 [Bacillus phage Pascal]
MCEFKNQLLLLEVALKQNPAVIKGVKDLISKYDKSASAPNTRAEVKSHIQKHDTLNSLIVFCFNCNLTNELTLKNVVSYKCRHCDWENRLSYMQVRYMREL